VVVICDRYRASSIAYGEAQGLDAAWLATSSSTCRRRDLTILLDIAPETAAGRKTTNRDKYERDLALLFARPAKATAARPLPGTGCGSTVNGRRTSFRPTSSRRSCR
jgi:hypothetical protein